MNCNLIKHCTNNNTCTDTCYGFNPINVSEINNEVLKLEDKLKSKISDEYLDTEGDSSITNSTFNKLILPKLNECNCSCISQLLYSNKYKSFKICYDRLINLVNS